MNDAEFKERVVLLLEEKLHTKDYIAGVLTGMLTVMILLTITAWVTS